MSKASIRRVVVAASIVAACASAACGLSLSGTSETSDDAGVAGDASGDTTSGDGGRATNDAGADAPLGADSTSDVATDSPRDAPCVPFDAGLGGPLALSAFSLKGKALYNNNGDGILTLTDSNKHEQGAAWYPTQAPPAAGFDATWTLRVGPNDTSGDGLAFAVLQAAGIPGVGDDGDGIGLRNLPAPDGGVVSGYAVVVDTYKSATDTTDLAATTLKLVAMPSFVIVAVTAVPVALNDGNVYAVDVSWRAPSTLTATLHGPGGATYRVTSIDPRLSITTRAFLGFTGSTGGASDSHNEIAGLTIVQTCN